MPRHQQVTTCRKSGGPISKFCTCEHCNLAVCSVCGAFEGGLTTDCPGTPVDFDKQREVYETPLDYTDARGWHQGERVEHRIPHFLPTRRRPEPPQIDPRTIVAPAIDWTRIDRYNALQHDLSIRAIAWVRADRACDELSATLAHAKDAADACREDTPVHVLITRLEEVRIEFKRACRQFEECEDKFRQAAHKLVAALEGNQS